MVRRSPRSRRASSCAVRRSRRAPRSTTTSPIIRRRARWSSRRKPRCRCEVVAAPRSHYGVGAVLHPITTVRALVRTWRGRFILVFVASQLLLPLHYYLVRRDPHDERFAWRMFSPTRMTHCTPAATLDGKPLDLGTEFHEAWLELASRGRFVVVEAMGRRLCERHPGKSVVLSIDCTYIDREPRRYGGYDLCNVPEL